MARPPFVTTPFQTFLQPSGAEILAVTLDADRVHAANRTAAWSWDRATGALGAVHPIDDHQAEHVHLHPGTLLAYRRGPALTVLTFSTDGGRDLGLRTFPAAERPPQVTFGPQGRIVITGLFHGDQGHVWVCEQDLTVRARVPSVETTVDELAPPPRAAIRGAALGPEGLAVIEGGAVRSYSSDGSLLWSSPPIKGIGPAIGVGPDGAVVVGAQKRLVCFDATGSSRWECKMTADCGSLVWSENGETIVTNKQVAIDARKGAVRAILGGPYAFPIAVSADGRVVAIANEPGKVNLYQLP